MSTRRLIVEVSSEANETALDGYIRRLIEDIQGSMGADLESSRVLLDVTSVAILETSDEPAKGAAK